MAPNGQISSLMNGILSDGLIHLYRHGLPYRFYQMEKKRRGIEIVALSKNECFNKLALNFYVVGKQGRPP